MSRFQTLTPASLSREAFIEAFADIYEHSPGSPRRPMTWVSTTASTISRGLHQRMADILLSASREAQLALINAHPDLAGKAAIRGELTASSTSEQAGAGIHECSAEEFARFTELNDAYKARFGFPFIKAVKGSNRHQILAAFEERIQHSADEEFATALAEINKIALFRLQQL